MATAMFRRTTSRESLSGRDVECANFAVIASARNGVGPRRGGILKSNRFALTSHIAMLCSCVVHSAVATEAASSFSPFDCRAAGDGFRYQRPQRRSCRSRDGPIECGVAGGTIE